MNLIKLLFKEFISAVWELIRLPFNLIGLFFKRVYALGWRKLVMLAIAAVVLTVFTSTAFFKATSTPNFCKSCHNMEPYFESWQASSHKNVDCMKCHAREGVTGYIETKFTALSMLTNYATGLYKRSKPWAEIDDKNCLECHETRLLDGKIEFTKGVSFDHAPHLTQTRRGRTLRCTSCHSQIVQGEHISVTTSTCFLCHFKNTEAEGRKDMFTCTKCHTAPVGEAAIKNATYDHREITEQGISCNSCHQSMWHGNGEVRKERCGTCHSSTAHLDRFNDLEFIHEWHIEKRKVDCQMCHDAIVHEQPVIDREIRSSCTQCHDDKHNTMSLVYQGLGSKLVADPMPDVMYESGVVCASCHKETTTGHAAAKIRNDACLPCHQESYRRLATDWRVGFSARITKLEQDFKQAGSHPKLEEARQDLALIKRGGPWHNPKFSDAVLTEVASVLKESGVRQPAHFNVPQASQQCLSCHSSITEVPVSKPWSSFNHNSHLSQRGISCTSCHIGGDPDNMDHGKRLQVGNSCNTCHHGVEAGTQEFCKPCHTPSRMLYLGALPGITESPSPMSAGDMSCTDCHTAPEYKKPVTSTCLECHDQEIVSDLEFKRGEITIAIQKYKGIKSDLVKLVELDQGRAVHNPDLAKKILSPVDNAAR